MKKIFLPIIAVLMVLSLCSCTISESGESLHCFTERMNNFDSSYSLTSSGYIYDKSKSTLTKFYKFNDNEIMLRFKLNKNNELKKETIILNKELLKNNKANKFINNSIKSFIHDETTQNNTISKINLLSLASKSSYNTKKYEYGSTVLMIDVTDDFVYITVQKNNL